MAVAEDGVTYFYISISHLDIEWNRDKVQLGYWFNYN